MFVKTPHNIFSDKHSGYSLIVSDSRVKVYVKYPYPMMDDQSATFEYDVVDTSDKLEDLIDCYILDTGTDFSIIEIDAHGWTKNLFNGWYCWIEEYLEKGYKVFGCIKTDRGLLYIARKTKHGLTLLY